MCTEIYLTCPEVFSTFALFFGFFFSGGGRMLWIDAPRTEVQKMQTVFVWISITHSQDTLGTPDDGKVICGLILTCLKFISRNYFFISVNVLTDVMCENFRFCSVFTTKFVHWVILNYEERTYNLTALQDSSVHNLSCQFIDCSGEHKCFVTF